VSGGLGAGRAEGIWGRSDGSAMDWSRMRTASAWAEMPIHLEQRSPSHPQNLPPFLCHPHVVGPPPKTGAAFFRPKWGNFSAPALRNPLIWVCTEGRKAGRAEGQRGFGGRSRQWAGLVCGPHQPRGRDADAPRAAQSVPPQNLPPFRPSCAIPKWSAYLARK
jgi:hypothetical protein